MGFIKGILLAVIFAFVAKKVYRGIWFLKPGMPIFEHTPGPCNIVKGANEGSEDMAVLPDGKVLISSGLRFRTDKYPDRKGKILLFDFKHPNKVEELDIIWKTEEKFFEPQFNPHGIDTLVKGKKIFVFVVNHDPTDAIERFLLDLKKKTLTHLETIRDPNMHYMNSVVAVDERSFYFSNFAYFSEGIMAELEMFLEFSIGSIASYNGKTSTTTILKSSYHLPNGLALSPDKKKLYLADIGNLEIDTFDIHSIDNVTLSHTLLIDTVVDNVQVDPSDGSLWLGCQPSVWLSLQYLKNPTSMIAPSHVLQVKVDKAGNPSGDVTEIYRDNGDQISTATVAVPYQRQVLIGSIYHNMVYCQIKN